MVSFDELYWDCDNEGVEGNEGGLDDDIGPGTGTGLGEGENFLFSEISGEFDWEFGWDLIDISLSLLNSFKWVESLLFFNFNKTSSFLLRSFKISSHWSKTIEVDKPWSFVALVKVNK